MKNIFICILMIICIGFILIISGPEIKEEQLIVLMKF